MIIENYFLPYWARSPSSSSMRRSWLYLAILSERLSEPVLIWPEFVATAMSAIVESSVSPERCEVTEVYLLRCASSIALRVSVSVPIWFKKDANPKYACYCSKVTEEQVIEAVVKNGAKTVKEVNAITGAMKNSNCKENNPLGVCCHKIIEEAIDKGLALK